MDPESHDETEQHHREQSGRSDDSDRSNGEAGEEAGGTGHLHRPDEGSDSRHAVSVVFTSGRIGEEGLVSVDREGSRRDEDEHDEEHLDATLGSFAKHPSVGPG